MVQKLLQNANCVSGSFHMHGNYGKLFPYGTRSDGFTCTTTHQGLDEALCQCTAQAQILEALTSMTSGSSTAMLASLDLRFPLVTRAPTCPPNPSISVHHLVDMELLSGCYLMPCISCLKQEISHALPL